MKRKAIQVSFTEEGEAVVHYPDGVEEKTGVIPSDSDRRLLKRFVASTTGRTFLTKQREDAVHDNLTQLLRRAPAHNIIAAAIRRLERIECRTSLSVLVMDLDHFKRVNDQHGHTVGDRVLEWFANILQRRTRAADVRARWGGE